MQSKQRVVKKKKKSFASSLPLWRTFKPKIFNYHLINFKVHFPEQQIH